MHQATAGCQAIREHARGQQHVVARAEHAHMAANAASHVRNVVVYACVESRACAARCWR